MLKQSISIRNQYHFVYPNELTPSDMLSVTSLAPQGALIAVGTERGFISLALNSHLNQLILVDIDPRVVLYNRINILLLKASLNLKDYQWLRTEATSQEILVRIFTVQNKNDFISLNALNWFIEILRNKDLLKSKVIDIGNYYYNEYLYERLAVFSRENLISAHHLDITSTFRTKLMVQSQLQNNFISIVDISNAWREGYAGFSGVEKFRDGLAAKLKSKSIFLFTLEPSLSGKFNEWAYLGFSSGNLNENPNRIRSRISSVRYNHHIPIQEFKNTIDFQNLCEYFFRD